MSTDTTVHPPNAEVTASNSTENVDRIREILFGSQMREYAQHFLQLEERLVRETAELKAELSRRLEFSEAHGQRLVDSLADRINTERDKRTESVERIARGLNDSVRLLDRRLRQSDEQVAKDIRELGQLMVDRHRSLSDQLMQSIAMSNEVQNRRLEEIRTSAIDRLTLSDLLSELSLRLRGEFRIPSERDSIDASRDK
jgi:hypothetical protein